MAYPQPMTVVGLGQYYHHSAPHNAVRASEIITELRSRGYVPGREIPPIEHHEAVLTRSLAIAIAVDYSIDKFNEKRAAIPHTRSHFYRCPSGTCYIDAKIWSQLSDWAAMVATGYLNKQFGIPSWAQSFLHSSLRGLGSTGFALGGFGDWIQENPWFVTTIGNIFTSYGQYLTAKQVKDALEANVPSNYLKKEDMASILAALQQQGVIQPGQERAVGAGVKAAATATPTWMMPAMIGGLALGALLVLQKK